MAFSAQTCGACNGSLGGQGMFIPECSHSYHLRCLLCHQRRACFICDAFSNRLPPQTNIVNPVNDDPFSNAFNNSPFRNVFLYPFDLNPQPLPLFNDDPNVFRYPFDLNPPPLPLFNDDRNVFRYPFDLNPPPLPLFNDDPLQFFDDEPLLVDYTPQDNSAEVAIKAIPELPAVAASEAVSLFTVLVGLGAPHFSEDAQRAPIDLVTVLDVSGSMGGQKLALVKQAVHFVIDNLGVYDRLSIVAFSDEAMRLLPLRRMTENGREEAHKAVDKLAVINGTNIVKGLAKGAKVLDERRQRNPVSSIIFLSDGKHTFNSFNASRNSRNAPTYLNLLPASIYPKNSGELGTIPVHSFGFGWDFDPITMHAISDASGGNFSFIESIEMVQDAFAGCIGGLLSVVSQEVLLKLRSASHGVEIKSIPSGRYSAEILNQGSDAIIKIGDLYADEKKEFLISLSVPKNEWERSMTTLLDITCSYKDVASKDTIQVEGDLVEIRRPDVVSPQDLVVNMEVDRQRNRMCAAESIKDAQQMAETGDVEGATRLLAKQREVVLGSVSARGGDSLCLWLGEEMKKMQMLMGSRWMYEKSGRAFALAGMSSHAAQRPTFGVPLRMPCSWWCTCRLWDSEYGFYGK